MTKRLSIVFVAMLAMLLFMGVVCAAQSDGDTKITANFEDSKISIKVPDKYTWTLAKTGDNQQQIGNVNVVANDGWTLTILGDNEGHLVYPSIAPTTSSSVAVTKFVLPVNAILTDGLWHTLSNSGQVLKTGSATGGQDVPVWVSQVVSSGDQTPATITLTFTGTIP